MYVRFLQEGACWNYFFTVPGQDIWKQSQTDACLAWHKLRAVLIFSSFLNKKAKQKSVFPNMSNY